MKPRNIIYIGESIFRFSVYLFIFIVALLAMTLCNGADVKPEAQPIIYVIDGLTRVSPDDVPARSDTIQLKSARNEYEPFQIVINGGNDGLKNVTVGASDLKSKDDSVIDSKNVYIYREHYLEVKTPSPKSPAKSGGWYPDALIPLIDPYKNVPLTGGRFQGMPFDVEAKKNQPLWVDIFVPANAKPGIYTGEIVISANNYPPKSVKYELKVWNFKLPDSPSLRSNFGGFGSRMAKGHNIEMNTKLFRTLEYRYSKAMAEHRLCPLIPSYLLPGINQDGSITVGANFAELKKWMEDFHITGFPLRLLGSDPTGKDRERARRYLQEMFKFLKSNGWGNLAYIYVLDEPNDAQAYEQLRLRAKLIHQAQPGIKVLCTEQPTPQKPEWGTLVGSVDIWVPLWPLFEENAIAERLSAGDEVWSYTALCQGERGKDTPFWQIDFPLLNYRVPMWISWRYGLKGILYWTTVYWEKAGDIWTNPHTYGEGRSVFNGEGMLFYPGKDVNLDGPVASMRLKQIREGFEDYEYLKLLADSGREAISEELAKKIGKSWTDWEKNPSELYKVREQIGELLSK